MLKLKKKLSDNEYLVAIRNKLFVGQAVQIVSPEIKVRDFVMPEMILLDKMGRETESVESANPNSFVKIKNRYTYEWTRYVKNSFIKIGLFKN